MHPFICKKHRTFYPRVHFHNLPLSLHEKNINATHYRNHFPGGFIRVSTRGEAGLEQVRYKIAARSLVLLFYPIKRKKSSFPSGETSPLYFSRNSRKDTKEKRGVEEGKEGAPLAFFLVPPSNPQTRGLNLPPWSLSFA